MMATVKVAQIWATGLIRHGAALLLAPIPAATRIEHIGRREVVGQHLALERLRNRMRLSVTRCDTSKGNL